MKIDTAIYNFKLSIKNMTSEYEVLNAALAVQDQKGGYICLRIIPHGKNC